MERWLQDRRAYAEALQHRVQRDGKQADILSLDRFLRQTARMQATAEQLKEELPSGFGLAHGLRLRHQGQEIYLEHLAVGPTGIFLIETFEGDDPAWLTDLARNITFFRQVLGAHGTLFTCLVVSRSAAIVELPEGAHLVDSVEAAIHVVRDQRYGAPLSPAVAREVWYAVQATTVTQPMKPGGESYSDRVGLSEKAFILAAIVMHFVLMGVDKENDLFISFFVAAILFLIPALGGLGLILLIRARRWRKAGVFLWMALSTLWIVALVAGLSEGAS